MEKTWDKYTKKELLNLPYRGYGKIGRYNSVLLVNTKEKHDSGFNAFVVIGCEGYNPIEIVGQMDDFRLDIFQEPIEYLDVAIDCSMNGVFRLHSELHLIQIDFSGSTTMFKFIKKKGCNL